MAWSWYKRRIATRVQRGDKSCRRHAGSTFLPTNAVSPPRLGHAETPSAVRMGPAAKSMQPPLCRVLSGVAEYLIGQDRRLLRLQPPLPVPLLWVAEDRLASVSVAKTTAFLAVVA